MAKGGRIAGGILALIGGAMLILKAFLTLFWLILLWPPMALVFMTTLVCGILAVVGGILLLVDKLAGGILALIAGALGIILTFFIAVPPFGMVDPLLVLYSFDTGVIGIDPLLALVGGIVGIAVGSEL